MRLAGVIGIWLAWWIGLFGLYLLLAAKLTPPEAVVGAGAAALAATGTTVAARAGSLHFHGRLSWLWMVGRLPGRVIVECSTAARALWRQMIMRRPVKGTFRLIPFDPGGDDAPSAARRAFVTATMSLAPNTYVVGIDGKRGLLLVHQLVPTPEPPGGGDRELPI